MFIYDAGIKDDETLRRALNETLETNGTVNITNALALVMGNFIILLAVLNLL